MKEWSECYPELVNKFRWAISTTFASPTERFPFGDSQRLGTVFAQEVLELVKCWTESPGVLGSTNNIRSFLDQERVQSLIDKS